PQPAPDRDVKFRRAPSQSSRQRSSRHDRSIAIQHEDRPRRHLRVLAQSDRRRLKRITNYEAAHLGRHARRSIRKRPALAIQRSRDSFAHWLSLPSELLARKTALAEARANERVQPHTLLAWLRRIPLPASLWGKCSLSLNRLSDGFIQSTKLPLGLGFRRRAR